MFGALGRLASRRPWIVIVAWIVFAVLVIAFAPKLKATNDQSEFLPAHYESIRAATLQAEAFPTDTAPGAIIVFDREDGQPLSADDTAKIGDVVNGLAGHLGPAFAGIAPATASQNGQVSISVVGLADDVTGYEQSSFDSVEDLRSDLKQALAGSDLEYGVTGTVAQGYDSQQATGNAEAIVGGATFLLIIILLSIIFRSVIIALLPIVVVGIVSQVATGLIGLANQVFDLKTDSSLQVILIVVLFGIGTDYILFFLFRHRERLREGEDMRSAVAHALERAGEAIASAGGAVIVAFLALTLSSLGIFRSIGPALAIAVATTLLAALTLVPALAAVLGRALYWPSTSWRTEPEAARFAALGRALGRHPGRFAAGSGAVLAVLAIFAFQFHPTFDLSDSGIPKTAESSVALKTLESGFSEGVTDPATVLLHSTDGQPLGTDATNEFGTAIASAQGVDQVGPPTPSEDGLTAAYQVFLHGGSASDASLANVKGPVRTAAHDAAPAGTEALVGGTTSIFVDFQSAMNRDYKVVFPVAGGVILIILMLLLRSMVAPWYLMASVGLGFGATLGATSILFQDVVGDSGLIFLLPIYIYLFVVALGTDYNILMIARLREEARDGLPPHEAAAEALHRAGPTIAAAGLILAGTFASLMLAGNALLVSLGFAISFGIFVAAFVMAMFFTPALTALVGHRAWWPGHGDER